METTANNSALHIWKLFKELILKIFIIHTNKLWLCDMMDVLTNFIMVIISQYSHVSSH